MSLLGAGLALAGGLLGSKSGSGTQTAEKKMDPRLDRYVYGEDGQGGLMGTAYGLMQDQLKTGGLNDLQRQGLEMQRQYLMSPQYSQGYTNMANLGQSLMGGGVAGNPFTGGGVAGNPFAASSGSGASQGGFQYQGLTNAQLPTYNLQAPLRATPQPTTNTGTAGGWGGGGSEASVGGGSYNTGGFNETLHDVLNTPVGAAVAHQLSQLGLLGPMTQTDKAPVSDAVSVTPADIWGAYVDQAMGGGGGGGGWSDTNIGAGATSDSFGYGGNW